MKPSLLVKFVLLMSLTFPAATDTVRQYYKYRSVTGTLNRITIKQTTRTLALQYVWFKCSVACTWSIKKNGTVSGGTSSTAELRNEKGYAAVSDILLDATVSGATTVNSETLTAGSDLPVIGSLTLPVASSARSITAELTSVDSGVLTVYVEHDEP